MYKENYYIIDYQEQGVGRIFWYAAGSSPEVLKTTFEMDDEGWEYFKIGIEVYETYAEAREYYSFLPSTIMPPAYMHTRWVV